MRKARLLPVAVSLVLAFTASGDTISLRNGTKVDGTIVDSSDRARVVLRDEKGNFRFFDREDVQGVELNDKGKRKPSQPAGIAPPSAPASQATPSQPTATDAAGELSEVIAVGTGSSPESARKDALRQAVSQVVGSLVVASDVVANDELIDSRILTYSDGYVERFETVGDPVSKDGLFKVKVRAWVRQGKLTKALADNKVPVKEVDLRSMQGQSETLAEQARSAEEVVAALFRGYPAKLLVAEPLTPVRIAGDEGGTVFEVPVRVRVDMARWKAFAAEAKRMLDPIAESKGTEAWNIKMAGWYPMAGAGSDPARQGPRGRTAKGSEEPDGIRYARSAFWLQRFVMERDRAGGGIFLSSYSGWQLPTPKVGTELKRVVAILDGLGGKLQWWQLTPDAWNAFTHGEPSMHLRVAIEDATGEAIAIAIQDWSEEQSSSKPGEQSRTVLDQRDGAGRPELMVGERNPWSDVWTFGCQLVLSPNRTVGMSSDGDYLRLLLPAGFGFIEYNLPGYANCVAPAVTFPRRFRIPGEIANLAPDSKVVAEFVDP